jgi:formamidopyrimidine-DNA glycosylase
MVSSSGGSTLTAEPRPLANGFSMPELPEVEIARRSLERWLGRSPVMGAEADPTRIFRKGERTDFEALRGGLASTDRHGKVLLVALDSGQGFLSHLGMTGKWVRRPAGQPEPYSRARLRLADGSVVHYRDTRLFGRIEPHPAERLQQLPDVQALGPDPWKTRLSGPELQSSLGPTKLPIKVALLDQTRLAGLGNIHAAEALWRARIHPARPTRSLRPAEWNRLATAVRATLRYALSVEDAEEIVYVEEPGGPNPFRVYDRAGERCRRCRTRIRTMRQGGRVTYFCPHCQPARRERR